MSKSEIFLACFGPPRILFWCSLIGSEVSIVAFRSAKVASRAGEAEPPMQAGHDRELILCGIRIRTTRCFRFSERRQSCRFSQSSRGRSRLPGGTLTVKRRKRFALRIATVAVSSLSHGVVAQTGATHEMRLRGNYHEKGGLAPRKKLAKNIAQLSGK
jgi:hypothetical protein